MASLPHRESVVEGHELAEQHRTRPRVKGNVMDDEHKHMFLLFKPEQHRLQQWIACQIERAARRYDNALSQCGGLLVGIKKAQVFHHKCAHRRDLRSEWGSDRQRKVVRSAS